MIKELKDEKNSRNHREPPEGEVELNKKDNIVNKLADGDKPPQFMTFSEVTALVEKERVLAGTRRFARRPLYPAGLLNQPYPDKYEVPTFTQYDRHKGNATEHINKFLDAMGPHAGNGNPLSKRVLQVTDRSCIHMVHNAQAKLCLYLG
jgi:hypothetical protein